ncbi:MAG: hypothetical protein A4E48_00147 [Methanosaeta sp. PtaU1.Bin060]|nr:MAG: hypothetical protein A4E48_00147 [Methanosaeta sp. PtaU1.Bin060]
MLGGHWLTVISWMQVMLLNEMMNIPGPGAVHVTFAAVESLKPPTGFICSSRAVHS